MTELATPTSSSSSSSSPISIKDPRYQRGKVYEIVLLHEDYQDETYVGSTISMLSQRLGQHKIESDKDEPTKKLHILMKTLGMRFFKIVLIEEWPCDNKQELLKREQYHMNLRKPTLNMKKAHRTNEEEKVYKKIYNEEHKVEISAYKTDYYEKNKDDILAQKKDYYEDNKVAILAQKKDYYEENKVALLAQKKIYAKENKEAISARQKDYYQENKDRLNAQTRARRAKAKLSYKDLVFLAVKEALALRSEQQRNERAGQP